MFASASERVKVLVVLLLGCGQPASYRFGENVTGLLFQAKSSTEGIYPDRSVLNDVDNPFRVYPLEANTKWNLQSGGASVAAFYAFATALANEPTGENQFYTAKNLAIIAQTGALKDQTQATALTTQAIAAYQKVLDSFPDSVSYDATGTTSFRLATPAYQAIVALGGKVTGGWVLVSTPNGDQAVHSAPALDGGM